jgi:hypothetical protein
LAGFDGTGWFNQNRPCSRAIATRYDKTARNFLAATHLAAVISLN